ncbi:MAG: NAD-dependent epimerase/dehydratase family protein [Paludibacter sp.]|nr:NAD-dependent epimerase/dehydratase family protein [Paludibacter sp.]
MKKSVWISGIAGFVGSNVANKLVKLGYDVNGCDNLKFGYSGNLDPEVKWINCGFEQVDFDFLRKYDVLLHMACANIIYAMENVIDTFKVNALDSIKLVELYNGQIVYTSTSSVYGNASHIPTPESAPENVSNAYDQSKLILERYLRLRSDYTTLRLSNVYGKNQRPENPYCGAIGKFIDSAFKRDPIKIYGDGQATRDYTYIEDVVNAIIMAIDQDPKNTEINIGTGVETSAIDLANMVNDAVGVPRLATHTDARKIDRISRRCLDISLAKALLGWEPKTKLSEGIENTIFDLNLWK